MKSHSSNGTVPRPSPTLSLYLDSSLIPSLPPPGGKLARNDLMRSAKQPSPSASRSSPSRVPSPISSRPNIGIWKPGEVMPSFIGSRAGVGEVTHGRASSTGSTNMAPVRRDVSSRPKVLRRISSLENPKSGLPSRHGRTSSDPLALNGVHLKSRSTDIQRPIRSTSLVGSSRELKLGKAGDKKVAKMLTTLTALTPAERMPTPPPPPPSSGLLAPISLLTPMAIILEVFVWEREMLKGHTPLRNLPLLRDGTTFNKVYEDSELDPVVDWALTRSYILAFSSLLSSLLPYLQDLGDHDTTNVQELTKSVRKYVGKMKKVFGEVAEMYVNNYGFVRGMWDEGPMKAAAGEVGRWGDLFDV